VQLFAAADEISLEIADNGVGFDQHGLGSTPGFGVRGLIERARGFDGWAEVNSTPGRGTTVMFSIPPGTAAAPTPAAREREWTDAG
jgi:two-component system sensor histidine kinase UhpB